MLHQILISGGVIAVTVIIHATLLLSALPVLRQLRGWTHRGRILIKQIIVLSLLLLWIMLAHLIEISVWAGVFVWFDALKSVEEAIYFSLVCFTTLGFGELVLAKDWRLLSAFCGANGFLLFSLSAAFLFEYLARFQTRASSSLRDELGSWKDLTEL